MKTKGREERRASCLPGGNTNNSRTQHVPATSKRTAAAAAASLVGSSCRSIEAPRSRRGSYVRRFRLRLVAAGERALSPCLLVRAAFANNVVRVRVSPPPVPALPPPPAPPPPDPTLDAEVFVLDVSLPGAAGYIQLQNDRDQRCSRLSAIHFNGVPMTTGDNLSYHIVRLTHPNYQQRVQLLFCDRDQYFLAFQRGDGRWYRFKDLVIPGLNAEILNMQSSHGEMLQGPSSNTAVGSHALLGMFVEFLEFNGEDVNGLVNITNDLKRASHWAVVTFAEGARFQSVRRLTCQGLNTGENVVIENDIWRRMRNWKRMSEYWVMCYRCEETGQPVEPTMVEKMAALGIHSFSDVRAELCMTLFYPIIVD